MALGDGALTPGLEWVSATIASKTLLGDLKDAVRRISDLVAAVRSYSQLDRASRQRIDVRDGLESTLTMLGHKLQAAASPSSGSTTTCRRSTPTPASSTRSGPT